MDLSDLAEIIIESEKLCQQIPYLRFPTDWEVQITPPINISPSEFTGVRFYVRHRGSKVVVFLDRYDPSEWGKEGEPFLIWEIYPYKGDTFRCAIEETDELFAAIQEALDDQSIAYELKEAAQDKERNEEIKLWDQI